MSQTIQSLRGIEGKPAGGTVVRITLSENHIENHIECQTDSEELSKSYHFPPNWTFKSPKIVKNNTKKGPSKPFFAVLAKPFFAVLTRTADASAPMYHDLMPSILAIAARPLNGPVYLYLQSSLDLSIAGMYILQSSLDLSIAGMYIRSRQQLRRTAPTVHAPSPFKYKINILLASNRRF